MNFFNCNKTAAKAGLLIFIILMISILAFAGTASADTFIVNASGGSGFETIQEAVNTSVSGDIILVEPGIYSENVYINKTLTLMANSTDPSETVIVTNDTYMPVITSYSVDKINVTISGFTIEGNGMSEIGIYFENCGFITISENIINETRDFGVLGWNTTDTTIIDNQFTNLNDSVNSTYGTYVLYSDILYLSNNTFVNIKEDAIATVYVNDTYIIDNNISNIGDDGIDIRYGNLADVRGNYIADLLDDACYIGYFQFINATNNNILNLEDDGFNVYQSNITNINYNSIENTYDRGIELAYINEAYVDSNLINGSWGTSYIYDGYLVEITNNTFSDANYGIWATNVSFVDVLNNSIDGTYESVVIEGVTATNIIDNIIDTEITDQYGAGIVVAKGPVKEALADIFGTEEVSSTGFDLADIDGDPTDTEFKSTALGVEITSLEPDVTQNYQSVIESNSINMQYVSLPAPAGSTVGYPPFGIAAVNINASLESNVITGAGTSHTFAGIASINTKNTTMSANIEGNNVDDVFFGLFTANSNTDIIANKVNMTYTGLYAYNDYDAQIADNTFNDTNYGIAS